MFQSFNVININPFPTPLSYTTTADHRRLEARPSWAVQLYCVAVKDKVGKTKGGHDNCRANWTLCSGGPGDASGGSGRARGRLLRPARGRDGQMGRNEILRRGEGVKLLFVFLDALESRAYSGCTKSD